jgi:ornithine carbamoyltransferase
MMGMDVRMVAPQGRCNHDEVIKEARRIAEATGARITHTEDVQEGVCGVDFLYTDVWLSMGEPKEKWDERIRLLGPYQVTMDVVRATGNPAVKFMHCLPVSTTAGRRSVRCRGSRSWHSNRLWPARSPAGI